MSKHNRERRLLWKLGLHKRQVRRRMGLTNRPLHEFKATHDTIRAAKAAHPLTRSTR